MLADTSVWVDHLRRRNDRLVACLETTQVVIHPFVIGELSCGNLARRAEILGLLQALPSLPIVEHEEVLEFLVALKLHGRGLGWIDMHLLASARLARESFWTLDKRLRTVADEIGVAPGL